MIQELFIYTIDLNHKDIISISSKNIGKIGDIVYQEKLGKWLFLPIENFFYKAVHLALIINKLNELNNYKKEK